MTTRLLFASHLLVFAAACGGSTPAPLPGNAASVAPAAPFLRSFDPPTTGSPSRRCTEADYRSLERHAAAPPEARAQAWAALTRTCWLDWTNTTDGGLDAAGIAAYVAYATALADASYAHDCESLLSPLTTPYPSGLESAEVPEELEELAASVHALGERCAAAAEAELASFAAPTCPSEDACFALVWPEGAAGDGGDDEDMTAEPCPEIEWRTPAGVRRLSAGQGALADGGFCCGLSAITTTVHDGARYLLVRPSGEDSMFIRVCSGGTASATPASVYRLDGEQLLLAADRTVVWN